MLLPPAAPLLIAAVHSEQNEVTVHVSQPAPTGNQPTVQRVEIWRKPDGAQGNGIIVAVISTEEWFTDRSLASGEDYEYRARAVGSNGTVAWSPWTDGDVTDDSTRPGAPSSLSLAASGGEVTAAWGVPSTTGGLPSPIYRYEWSHDGVRWFTGTTTERTATIPGRYRHTFYFKVAAVNAVGRGSWGVPQRVCGTGVARSACLVWFVWSGVVMDGPDRRRDIGRHRHHIGDGYGCVRWGSVVRVVAGDEHRQSHDQPGADEHHVLSCGVRQ